MEGFFYFYSMNRLHAILFIFLLIPFVPKLGSVDVIGPQWFLFSCLNLIFLVYNFLSPKQILFFKSNSIIVKTYILFFALLIVSLSYSININLTIHDLARDINVFILFFNIYKHCQNTKLNFFYISLIFSLILFLEVLFSMKVFLTDFFKDGFQVFNYTNINQNAFLGITGNKNITAASIVLKLPFLLYIFYKSTNRIALTIICLFLAVIAFDLSVLSARASLLSFVFILISFAFLLLIKKSFYKFLLLPFFIGFGVFISILFIPSNSNNPINRLSSIEVSNESSSFRLELWEDAFSYLKDKLFYGSGRGSWKIESAQFWSEHGKEYLVPYHAHNDFLEIGTELGWLGLLVYTSIFVFSFYYLIKSFLFKKQIFSFFIFLALATYFVDAFFNFPMERPIMQLPFAIILFITSYFELSKTPKLDD